MSTETPTAPCEAVAGTKYVVVRSGGDQFGLPTSCVRGLLRNHPVYPVPGSKAPLVGLVQVGGEPAVVVDIKELVDGRAGAENHPLIMLIQTAVGAPAQTVGLAIDEALEIVTVPRLEDGGSAHGVVIGEITHGERPTRLVDPERVIGPSSSATTGAESD